MSTGHWTNARLEFKYCFIALSVMRSRSYKLIDSFKLSKQREFIRNFIRQNPDCTYQDIKAATKIKIERIYKNMREAYTDSGVPLSKSLRKRTKDEQKMAVIEFIRQNPSCTVLDIQKSTKANVSRLFGTMSRAYEMSYVQYFARSTVAGAANPKIFARAKAFETKTMTLLAQFGVVHPKVRTSVGIVDCLFRFKNNLFVVEIKDFRATHNITHSQIKQLLKYMAALNCDRGLVICPKDHFPRRKNGRNLYKDGSVVKIISPEDIPGELGT